MPPALYEIQSNYIAKQKLPLIEFHNVIVIKLQGILTPNFLTSLVKYFRVFFHFSQVYFSDYDCFLFYW